MIHVVLDYQLYVYVVKCITYLVPLPGMYGILAFRL